MELASSEDILILGGGYGGLRVALSMAARQGPRFKPGITLMDRNNFHQLVTLWHEVAAASFEPEDITVPFSRLLANKKVIFREGTVLGFDFPKRIVHTSTGELSYNKLVIALGSQTAFFGIPGIEQNALTINSLTQCMRIRNTIQSRFQQALQEHDERKRESLLTFVVGGGGFTGTELAGQLADWFPELAMSHGIAPNEVRLLIVEASDQLLRGFDSRLVNVAKDILHRKGIEINLGQPVAEVRPESVLLKSGEEIFTRTFIWAGGVCANDLVARSGLKTGASSRILISPFSESVDYEGVFLVGDNSLVIDPRNNRPMAPSAQLAIQQGNFVARHIWRESLGLRQRRFVPRISAEIVSLGRRSAIAYLWGKRINGMPAAILKQLTMIRYAYSIGGIELAIEKAGVLMPLRRWTQRDLREPLYGEQAGETNGASKRSSYGEMPGMQPRAGSQGQGQEWPRTEASDRPM